MQIYDLLPKLLQNDPLWGPLFQVYDEVVGAPLEQRLITMRDAYNIDSLTRTTSDQLSPIVIDENDFQKIGLIKNFASFLGYHYTDNGKIGNSDLVRFIDEATRFITVNGTGLFSSFMAYLLNSTFQVDLLWYDPTDNQFYLESQSAIAGRRIVLDGTSDAQDCFPTSYIQLTINSSVFGTNDIASLTQLFYSVAPEEMVLHQIVVPVQVNISKVSLQYSPKTNIVVIADEVLINGVVPPPPPPDTSGASSLDFSDPANSQLL